MIDLNWLGWILGFLFAITLVLWLYPIFFGGSPSDPGEDPVDERRELRKGDKL